jgi:hypothetical protein
MIMRRRNQRPGIDHRKSVNSTCSVPRTRQHGADAALADRGQKLLKAGPPRAGSRSAKVVVDHLDVDPPQLAGSISQAILTPLALDAQA